MQDNELQTSRIETLETQVKDLQEIRKELQNKVLNSEKVIIEKNSMIRVNQALMKEYSNQNEKLKSEVKEKLIHIEVLQYRVKILKGVIFKSMAAVLITLGYIVYLIVKESL